MYENSLPVRFGVLLYSSKLVEAIEKNDGLLPSYSANDEFDVSTLVTGLSYYCHLCFHYEDIDLI